MYLNVFSLKYLLYEKGIGLASARNGDGEEDGMTGSRRHESWHYTYIV